MAVITCPKCKTINLGDAKYCRHCGVILSDNKKPDKKVSTNPDNDSKKEDKTATIIIYSLAIVVCIGLLFTNTIGRTAAAAGIVYSIRELSKVIG